MRKISRCSFTVSEMVDCDSQANGKSDQTKLNIAHTNSPLNYSKNLFSKLWLVQMISLQPPNEKLRQTVVGNNKNLQFKFAHNADEASWSHLCSFFDVQKEGMHFWNCTWSLFRDLNNLFVKLTVKHSKLYQLKAAFCGRIICSVG